MNAGIADFKDMPAADFVATRADGRREEAARISESDKDRALIVEAWQAGFAADDRVHTIYAEEMAAQHDQPWAERLRVRCALPKLPSVVLSATAGMPLDMRRLFTGLQGEIAAGLGAEHVSVADSGHYIHRDQPEAVIEAVSRTIASRGRDVS